MRKVGCGWNSSVAKGSLRSGITNQSNEYFAKKAAEGKLLKVDWECLLVVGVFLGVFASSKLSAVRH